jgi:hypothetical protein
MKLQQEHLIRLHEILVKCFDAEELRTLCFELGLDYDDLRGEGKSGKARELVALLDRRGRIAELVAIGKDLRPDAAWEVDDATIPPPTSIPRAERLRIAIIPVLLAIVLTYIFTPLHTDNTSTLKVPGDALEQPGSSVYSAEDDWFASFMMDIEPNGWSLGEHQYSITIDCPQPYSVQVGRVKFNVSNESELKPGTLYLRQKGIFDERFVVGPRIDIINPSQKTAVSVALTRLTELEARRRSKDCKVAVEWDNGPSIPVSPLEPGGGQPGGDGGDHW